MTKLHFYLPLAGTLPFIAGAICIALNILQIPLMGDVKKAFITYGIIICGFMAGAHWGQSLNKETRATAYLPVLSNLLTIALWFGATILSFLAMVTLLAVLLVILLGIDRHLNSQKQILNTYFKIRCLVTTIVLFTLGIAGIFA